MKKIGSLVLAVCLLLCCVDCDGGEQEEIYSSALGESATEAAVDVGEEQDQESSSSEEEETAFFVDPYNPSFNYLESRPSPEELFPVEENTEFSGTLTISTSIGSEMLENWAAAFEAAYPNVEVEIDAGFDSVAAAARAEEQGGTAFRGMNMFGITAGCENPELAWEFLKFMISQKDFPERLHLYGDKDEVYRELYGGNLPIHRGNLQALCDAYFQDSGVFEAADRLMKQFTSLQFQEGELGASLLEIYLDYYQYDLITAEECAKQLQERAWIYFNE